MPPLGNGWTCAITKRQIRVQDVWVCCAGERHGDVGMRQAVPQSGFDESVCAGPCEVRDVHFATSNFGQQRSIIP